MLKWLLLAPLAAWLLLRVLGAVARRAAARQILEHGKRIYGGKHEYVEASIERFPHLDAGFYERTAAELEQSGFRRLADLENLTMTKAGGIMMPAMLRVMVSEDGTIVAGIYHARAKGATNVPGTNSYHIVDFESAMSDGRSVTTSNAELAGALTSPPEILAEFHAFATMPFMLLERHRRRIQGYVEGNPGVSPVQFGTIEQVLEHQARMDEIKTRFREARPGVFSEEELRRLAPEVDAEFTADVAERMRKLDG